MKGIQALEENIMLKWGELPLSTEPNNRKSRLKTVNTILKDPKYRGKTTSRAELFGEVKYPENYLDSSDEEDGIGSAEAEEEESGEELPNEERSDLSDALDIHQEDEWSESETSDTNESDEEAEETQDDRREKVRELLAQQSKYVFLRNEIDDRTVTEQLNESAQADAEKGQDIKKQQVRHSLFPLMPEIL
jgi:hypothetical protein